jgi:hypothetical protein
VYGVGFGGFGSKRCGVQDLGYPYRVSEFMVRYLGFGIRIQSKGLGLKV